MGGLAVFTAAGCK